MVVAAGNINELISRANRRAKLDAFRRQVEDAGFIAVEVSCDLWWVFGGPATVKVTPFRRGTVGRVCIHGSDRTIQVGSVDEIVRILKSGKLPRKCKGTCPPNRNSARKHRERLYAASPFCHWCGVPFSSVDDTTLDHIVARSRGGLNQSSNYALSCYGCNQDRSNRLVGADAIHSAKRYAEEFLEKMIGLSTTKPQHFAEAFS